MSCVHDPPNPPRLESLDRTNREVRRGLPSVPHVDFLLLQYLQMKTKMRIEDLILCFQSTGGGSQGVVEIEAGRGDGSQHYENKKGEKISPDECHL